MSPRRRVSPSGKPRPRVRPPKPISHTRAVIVWLAVALAVYLLLYP